MRNRNGTRNEMGGGQVMHINERNTSIMFCKDCYIVWHIDWKSMISPLYCGFTYYEDKDGKEEDRHSYCMELDWRYTKRHRLVVVNNK